MVDIGSLSVEFTAEGVQKVLDAIKQLNSQVDAMGAAYQKTGRKVRSEEDKTTAKLKEEERKRAKAVEESNDQKEKEYRKLAAEVGRWEQEQVRQVEKAEKEKVNAVRKSIAERERLIKKFVSQPIASGVRRAGMLGGMLAGAAVSGFAGEMLSGGYDMMKSTRNQAATLDIVSGHRLHANDLSSWALKRGAELGMGGDELLAGQAEMAKHLPMTEANMKIIGSKRLAETMAMGSKAYEISPEDVGKLTSQFVDQTGANENQTNQFLLNAFNLGKNQRIPMSDLASHIGKIGAEVNKFKYTGPNATADKAAMFQEMMGFEQIAAKGGRVSATEAQTSALRMFSRLESMNDKQLGKLGLSAGDIFTDKNRTSIRAPDQMIGNIIEKTHGNISKMEQIFGPRAAGVVEPLLNTYNQAEAKSKGSGLAAVQNQIKDASGALPGQRGSEEALRQDLQVRLNADPVQKVMIEAQNKLAGDMETHMPAMVSSMEKLTASMDSLPKALAASIGGVMAGTAGGTVLGNLGGNIAGGLAGKLAGSRVGQAVGGAAVAASPILGAVGIGAAIGAPVALAIGAHMVNDEKTLTYEQKLKGSAAQFSPNAYDDSKTQGAVDKFLISIGSLVVGINDALGTIKKDQTNDAGPKGSSLPGQNKE